jgi:hypothetical protein
MDPAVNRPVQTKKTRHLVDDVEPWSYPMEGNIRFILPARLASVSGVRAARGPIVKADKSFPILHTMPLVAV